MSILEIRRVIKAMTHAPRSLRLISMLAAAALGTMVPMTPGLAQGASSPGGAYPGTPTVQQRNQLLDTGDGQVHVQLVIGTWSSPQSSPSRRTALTPVHLSLIHISEPTRQAEISYAVFCLKKK